LAFTVNSIPGPQMGRQSISGEKQNLPKAKVIAEISKSKADEPEYFINLGHFESKITFYSARKPQWQPQSIRL
jgi:hypothetical protein